jgi:hypothetical protein
VCGGFRLQNARRRPGDEIVASIARNRPRGCAGGLSPTVGLDSRAGQNETNRYKKKIETKGAVWHEAAMRTRGQERIAC